MANIDAKLLQSAARGIFVSVIFVVVIHFFVPTAKMITIVLISIAFPVGFLLSGMWKKWCK